MPAAKLHLDIVLWHQSTADLMWPRTRAYPDKDPLIRTTFVAKTCLQETSKYLSEKIFWTQYPNEANKENWMYAKEKRAT